MGLLGLRNNILDVYGDEQLRDSLGSNDARLLKITDHWETILNIVLANQNTQNSVQLDILLLLSNLVSANLIAEAARAVSIVIESGQDDANVYSWRGAIRHAENQLEAAADYSEA